MRKKLPFLAAWFCLFSTCGVNSNREESSENHLDAARNFIRAALDGKFREARRYMLPDSVNNNWMDVAERSYNKADAATREGYRGASINIHQAIPVNDSLAIVIYSNSYMNDHDTLKILRERGAWLVDLKYLFEHDSDTLLRQPVINDTIR